jgi:sugar phosphate isomerase/epimerase
MNMTTTTTRRGFLGLGLAGAATLMGGNPPPLTAGEPPATTATLRLSTWLNTIRGDLSQQLDYAEKMGFEAIELRGDIFKNIAAWKEALTTSRLKVSALDWSSLGPIVGGVPAAREQSLDHLKRSIDAAAELKAPNLIVVPPRLSHPGLPDAATSRRIIIDTLGPLAETAAKAGTCIMLEPVNRKSVNCLHFVADVASVCREINSPGIGLVADFCQMIIEETNLTGAILSGGKWIRQIHLSGRNRSLPGHQAEDEQFYREGFRGLKLINYPGYCSFECGKIETYQEQIAESMAFLRTQWSQS